jgi:Nucleotide modification associated domain 3
LSLSHLDRLTINRPSAIVACMKIILSRKGFDASAGKVASPILPSGGLCSLPIPEPLSSGCSIRYADLHFGEHNLGKLVCDLTRGKILKEHLAHLDPDLNGDCFANSARLPGWKPLFGQTGTAEGHLQRMSVQPGDLFLFYGWFRRVEWRDGTYRYVRGAPDLHVLFGWLQIERRIPVAHRGDIPDWALYHPHCQRAQPMALDSLYVASDRLTLPGVSVEAPGAGIFRRYHPSLCLTNRDPYQSRRHWRLPAWVYPAQGKTPMTYHPKLAAWQREDGYTLLRTAGRGQEFVLDCDEYPEALEWAAQLLMQA